MSTQVSLSQKLLNAQKVIDKVTKGSNNPHFRSTYADLNAVLSVAKQTLNEMGVFIAQAPGKDQYGQYVETSLINADDGQQIPSRVYFSGAEDNMQKVGAAITYARRFGLKSLLAMEDTDDDGETAVGRGNGTSSSVRAQSGESSSTSKDNFPKGNAKAVSPTATPLQKEVSKESSQKTVLEKIALVSKVLVDSKRTTQEEVVSMLKVFAVASKEELTDEQAKKLLSQLEEKLNK